MTYLVDGNINFYDELYKSLDVETEEEDENTCLITNTVLKENYVTLDCSHKFNYDAIFNDIYNHKKIYNIMEKHCLKSSEIRCPYCRNIQQKLLPFVEGFKKVHGVNFFDENVELSNNNIYNTGNCCYNYNTQNKIIDLSEQNINDIIQKKCYNTYGKTFNDKFYCILHYNYMHKNLIDKNKLIKKKEMEDKKLKIKQLIILAKTQKKQEKEEKKEQKIQKKNQDQQNIVIAPDVCSQILKSGKNKGTQCCKKITNNGLCTRHKII
jgi:hypothetical protein